MLAATLYLGLGLVLLVASAERFVSAAAVLALNLRIAPLLVGVIVVGFGTSMPEILVSAIAAWEGKSGLAIGNAIGSNITNIALILGAAALIRPLAVHSQVLRRELPILLVAMLAGWVLLSNGRIDRIDGILLLLAFVVMLYWMIAVARRARAEGIDPGAAGLDVPVRPRVSTRLALIWLVVGLVVLLVSSRLLVWAAVMLAGHLGVSDLVIGLTVVAVGTSLPELAASTVAAVRKDNDIAIGNIVGSNTFNTLAVLGLPGLIAPGPFPPEVLVRDVPVMVVLTLVMFAMAYGIRSEGRIGRFEGGLLLASFAGYQWLVFGGWG